MHCRQSGNSAAYPRLLSRINSPHVIAQKESKMVAAAQRPTAELKKEFQTTTPGMGFMPGGVRQYRG
jgi:ribosome-associated toxin RatA of RatAB toxin-antitoxin module